MRFFPNDVFLMKFATFFDVGLFENIEIDSIISNLAILLAVLDS